MAVRSKEELMQRMNSIIGERTDDDALEFVSDFTDTFDSLSSHEGMYTKEQYDSLDASWRQKYMDRFFSGPANDDESNNKDSKEKDKENPSAESITIKDLFTLSN